jgi:hypothetical protein
VKDVFLDAGEDGGLAVLHADLVALMGALAEIQCVCCICSFIYI